MASAVYPFSGQGVTCDWIATASVMNLYTNRLLSVTGLLYPWWMYDLPSPFEKWHDKGNHHCNTAQSFFASQFEIAVSLTSRERSAGCEQGAAHEAAMHSPPLVVPGVDGNDVKSMDRGAFRRRRETTQQLRLQGCCNCALKVFWGEGFTAEPEPVILALTSWLSSSHSPTQPLWDMGTTFTLPFILALSQWLWKTSRSVSRLIPDAPGRLDNACTLHFVVGGSRMSGLSFRLKSDRTPSEVNCNSGFVKPPSAIPCHIRNLEWKASTDPSHQWEANSQRSDGLVDNEGPWCESQFR